MGTSWTLLAVSPPEDTALAVQSALDRVVAQMSQWEQDSDLSRLNRSAPGRWRGIPAEFAQVLDAALKVSRASGGAFDPAMGALSDLWGFGPAPSPAAEPAGAVIAAMMANKGGIELDALSLRARRSGQARLDFSGIAKGFGVDLACDVLRTLGLRHFLIEVGGELRGEGMKPDGQPWWVDVEPPPGVTTAPLRIALHGLAVATSGDYRRWIEIGGKRRCHTIDPRTGRPVDGAIRSVTVVHQSCMLADAWATAITVLGPSEGMALAEREDLTAHMLAGDRELLSSSLREMLG